MTAKFLYFLIRVNREISSKDGEKLVFEHSEIVNNIRKKMNKLLLNFNDNFEIFENMSSEFMINGAICLSKDSDFTFLERELINNENIFIDYKNKIYSRARYFYDYEIFPSEDFELNYLNKLESKLSKINTFLNLYIIEVKECVKISKKQWKFLYALVDLYVLILSQLFNLVSYLIAIKNKLLSSEYVSVKKYYSLVLLKLSDVLHGNFIEKVDSLEINFENIKNNVNKLEKKVIDKDIIRGAYEANNHLFNEIWSMQLSEKIILIGLHYGGLELPFLLKNKLKALGFIDIETISCHYSSKMKNPNLKELFDTDVSKITSKNIYVLDDSISSGKSLFTIYNFLEKELGVEPKVSVVNLERLEGSSYKRGIIDPNFLKKIDSIVRISPIAKCRSIEERNRKRADGKFHLSRWIAKKILYNN